MKAINQTRIQNQSGSKGCRKIQQSNENSDTKKQGIQHIKAKLGLSLKKKWESKVIHGQSIRSMDRQLISEKDSYHGC